MGPGDGDLGLALRHQDPQQCVCDRERKITKARLGQPVLGPWANGARTKETPAFTTQKAYGNGPGRQVRKTWWRVGDGPWQELVRVLSPLCWDSGGLTDRKAPRG